MTDCRLIVFVTSLSSTVRMGAIIYYTIQYSIQHTAYSIQYSTAIKSPTPRDLTPDSFQTNNDVHNERRIDGCSGGWCVARGTSNKRTTRRDWIGLDGDRGVGDCHDYGARVSRSASQGQALWAVTLHASVILLVSRHMSEEPEQNDSRLFCPALS